MKKRFEILVNDDSRLVSTAPIREEEQLLPELNLFADESAELMRIKNKQYRKQWINSRWLAVQCRNLIKSDIPEISKSAEGKPFIKNSDLHISLSHNANISSVMLSNVPCGVDVESFRSKITRIQNKFLAKSESAKWSENVKALTLIWSAKESLYKMLSIPGLIFKDEIECRINEIKEEGHFQALIKGKKEYRVDYKIFDEDLITFTQLTNTLK